LLVLDFFEVTFISVKQRVFSIVMQQHSIKLKALNDNFFY
jgi:hypothetical protein